MSLTEPAHISRWGSVNSADKIWSKPQPHVLKVGKLQDFIQPSFLSDLNFQDDDEDQNAAIFKVSVLP